ncbi:hypothetical protein EG328_003588 [Venturia inaequalis]|uniref:Peptidase A2 domain-containing protein n=1 Tax=Venturia inaequalis TaxID=5025 RepID=A0A8H3YYZ4_VENIN|nr:hypothetical protein EG328_003588 [Venturia inaequalis]
MSDPNLISNTTLAVSAGVLTAAVLWSNRRRMINNNEACHSSSSKRSITNVNHQKEDFVRTLQIRDPAKKIKARLDTGADYSVLSQEIVDALGLREQTLDEGDDPLSVVLPDSRMFCFRSKVTLTFHVIDPPRGHSLFHFNKYEYTATFYVPADGDISSFDAYIGKDLIAKHHLQSSSFFAIDGEDGEDGKDGKDVPVRGSKTAVLKNTTKPSEQFDADNQTDNQRVGTEQLASYPDRFNAPESRGRGSSTGHAGGAPVAPALGTVPASSTNTVPASGVQTGGGRGGGFSVPAGRGTSLTPGRGTSPTSGQGTSPTSRGGTSPTSRGGTSPTSRRGTSPTSRGGTSPTSRGGTHQPARGSSSTRGSPFGGYKPAPFDSSLPSKPSDKGKKPYKGKKPGPGGNTA